MGTMINPSQKLNKDVFDGFDGLTTGKGVEKKATRDGFGEGLVLAGEKNENVVALCADLTESLHMAEFKKKFPKRFVEVGVAEQNLVTVASGMASEGKIPFAGSFAVFSPGRNWEQIRTTICYNDRPVKIVGSHTGISVGSDGGSHQALEDIALMRVLPRMVVLSPCDAIEARKAVLEAVKTNTPVYLRLAREKTPIITTENSPFEIGKAEVFWQPVHGKSDVLIVATGTMVFPAMRVAKDLEKDKVSATVLNIHTIKPLDEKTIIKFAKEAGAIVTVEEHQIVGGMGSAVAECLAKNFPTPIEFVGVRDSFGQSGTTEELFKYYGLDDESIKRAVKKVLKRKNF